MFFFFKQKTAYEMRISDWSSDVCSSDLKDAGVDAAVDRIARRIELGRQRRQTARQAAPKARQAVIDADLKDRRMIGTIGNAAGVNGVAIAAPDPRGARSEEHTSELQPLMRISYADFCLKKKKHSNPHI